MRTARLPIAVLVCLFAAALAAAPGAVPAAAEARIAELQPTVDGHRVLLDFRLDDAFDRQVVARLESGLPTGFTYEIELLRDRKRWFDRPLQRTALQVTAMYDAEAREYLVNYKLDGKLVESRMVRSREALEAALTRFDDLPAFVLKPLDGRWRLLVKVRALLGSGTLFSFIPVREATGWRESRKFFPPDELMP